MLAAVATAIAALVVGQRPARSLVLESAAAVATALAVATPYLVHAFLVSGPAWQPRRSANAESTDVLGLLVPGRRVFLRPPWSDEIAAHFTATAAERGSYLGPLAAILVLAAFARPRAPHVRIALVAAGVLVALSLGPRVRVDGHVLAIGAWEPLAKAPLTSGALPVRMSLFVSLAAAVAFASWIARGGRIRLAVAAGTVLALAPNPASRLWSSDVPRPAFFAGPSTTVLRRHDTVLVLPYGPSGWSLLWQAEDGFRYRLVGGHFGKRWTPPEARWQDVYRELASGRRRPGDVHRLHTFLQAHAVAEVVVAPGTPPAIRRLVESLGLHGTQVADAVVYVPRR